MSLTSRISIAVTAALVGAADLATVTADLDRKAVLSLANGTAAGKADLIFSDTRTLSASATEDLDLNGVLTDALGATLSMVKVKALIVIAAAGNTNDVVVGGAASNGFTTPFSGTTPAVKVRPGGFLVLGADGGYAVTASTGDILKMTNSSSGSSVTYDIIVIGTSA